MKKTILLILLFLPCLIFSQKKQYPDIDILYKKYVLSNGLTLIVSEDHKEPIASFNIWYHVGSKNEKPGKTGFAHLFEHIMFTSTEHWNNYDSVMQTVGGGSNDGTTSRDRTNYFETFSKTGLDRVLWLEADRMGFLLKGLDSVKVNVQRGVVKNEKRQRENQPYAVTEELTTKSTYPEGHPYSWTILGSMYDLNAASMNDVKEWFKAYYGPNNAVICIAGDVNPDEVFEKVKKYFGDIPASPPISKNTDWIAKMSGIHYQTAQDRVPQALLQKTWNIPGWGTKDMVYLDLLTKILANGKSSRLYKRLVYDEPLGSNVYSYIYNGEIGSQFYIAVYAKPGVDLSKINLIINEELQKIFTLGVTEKELERAKTDYFVQFIGGIEHIGGFGSKSDILAESETFGGSPDYFRKIQNWIKAASPADLKKSAILWLGDGEYVLKVFPYGDFTNTDSKLDRSEMPPVPQAPTAKFPEIQQLMLKNGLNVYLVEQHSAPVVEMSTSFNAGFSADQTGSSGLAYLTGKMMTEGTTTKSSTQISDILTDLGTTLRVYSSVDRSYINMRSLKANFGTSLLLYADVLLNPNFPQKDFERVQKEQVLTILQEQASPSAEGLRILPGLVYGKGHAYGVPFSGSGTVPNVQQFTRSALIKFYQEWFRPNNAFMVVVGDITMDELKQKLENNFDVWRAAPVTKKIIGEVKPVEKSIVYLIDKPGAEQSVIYAAETGVSGSDANYDAFELMNNILGGTFLSRLNMNLREDKHWSYHTRSFIYKTKGPGIFIVSAPVQMDKTKESLMELQKELTQLNSTKPIAGDEFKNEQTSTVLSVPGDWESMGGMLYIVQTMVEYNKGKDYVYNYPVMLQHFTLDDIHQAARLVKPEHMTWLIIGDRSKIQNGIQQLNMGDLIFLDKDGKEIK